jgi:hypothetical protein
MFDSIIYTNTTGPGPLIDIGALAEGLIFYGRVAIVGNTATLKYLLTRIPPLILLSLLEEGRIEFYYLADQIAVLTTPLSDGRSRHGLVCFSSPEHTIEKVGPRSFRAAAGSTGRAILGASQFGKLLRPFDHGGFDQNSILQALCDNVATEASVEALIRIAAPGYKFKNGLRFRIERQNNDFYVDTNIDFNRVNESYHKVVPVTHSTMSESYLLALLQAAHEATYFAGTLNSEVAVGPVLRIVQAERIEAVVRRHTQSESKIESFVDLTLSDGHAIREAVNSGTVSFASVVKLLGTADKFRHWLREQPADATLLKAYYQEIIKDSWAEKLPTKSLRWSIFLGLGLGAEALGLGMAASVAISAVDQFLVDKLIKGWKPHQFIEGDFKSLFDGARRMKK